MPLAHADILHMRIPWLLMFGLLQGGSGRASDSTSWPTWRGPAANGSIDSGSYPQRLSSSNIVWKLPLPGKGSSTPIAWTDRIFLTTPAEGQDAVLAVSLDGKQLWLAKLGSESPPKHRTLGSSCNASPVTDGKNVFVYFRSGRLASLDFDGKLRWQINLTEQFGEEQLFWDQGTSPAITGQHVIVSRLHGGPSWVAGFDKTTGALRWKISRTFEAPIENDNGYGTPLLFEHHGRMAFLIWGADRLTAHDAINGATLWTCDGFNPQGTGYWPAIASPVISGSLAIIPVGRDDRAGQARIHAVRLDGSGDVSASHRAWKREDMGVFVASPIEFKGRIFLLRHRGEIVCLDPANGSTHWTAELPRDRAPYYASPAIASGIFYAAREDGTIFAARIGAKFELLSQDSLGERVIATPVPFRNHLIVRGDKHLFAIR